MRVSQTLISYSCHGQGGAQFFAFTSDGQIMTYSEKCLGISIDKKSVVLFECTESDKSQLWDYRKEVNILSR